MNQHQDNPDRYRHPLLLFFIGVLPMIAGIIDILLVFDVLEYVDTRPNQIAIFNDPHTWEVFALGTTLLFFGIGNLIPPRMKSLLRIIRFLFLISVVAVVIGVILKKIY